MSGNQVQNHAGGGGGFGGRGVGSRARETNFGLWWEKPFPSPNPTLIPRRDALTGRPLIRGGGVRFVGSWGGVRVRVRLNSPSPRPHPNDSHTLSQVSLREKGHWLRVMGVVRVGTGALMGVARLRIWVVGGVLVPRTCLSSRLSNQDVHAAPGASMEPGRGGGGRGGEHRGIVGPPSTPLPLARPEKNSARGRGVEGGVISSLLRVPLSRDEESKLAPGP